MQLSESVAALSRHVEASTKEKQDSDSALSDLQSRHDAAVATIEQLRVCEWHAACGLCKWYFG